MNTPQGHQLDLRNEQGGWRHYLAGQPIHAGTTLEVLTEDGWQPGRYEWSYDPNSLPFLVTDSERDEVVIIRDDTVLRWPE